MFTIDRVFKKSYSGITEYHGLNLKTEKEKEMWRKKAEYLSKNKDWNGDMSAWKHTWFQLYMEDFWQNGHVGGVDGLVDHNHTVIVLVASVYSIIKKKK